MINTAIALGAPFVKIVTRVVPAFDVGVDLVGAIESADFLSVNRISGTAAANFALSIADHDDGSVTCFVDVDLVVAGTEQGESQIGSVDFKGFVIAEAADTDAQDRKSVV